MYFYSGEIVGSFSGSEYVAFWDGKFYAMGDPTFYMDIYVFDNGEGSKEAPVMYFPPTNPVTADDVDGMTFADAEAAGGTYGYISFSDNNNAGGIITSGISLYTISAIGDTFSEVPRNRGGQIVTINYVDASVAGQTYDYFIGGYFGDYIVEWNANSDVAINLVPAVDYKNLQEGESFTFDVIATDDDSGTTTTNLYEVDETGTIIASLTDTFVDKKTPPGGGGGGGGGGSTSGTQRIGATLALSFVGLLVSLL